MKKTFGAKIGFVPYASVIIGTYDENNTLTISEMMEFLRFVK